MLRSLRQLSGNKIGATDGDIGAIKDFYFDDQNWAIRYLVIDTGSWLPGRQVLLTPHSLGRLDQKNKILKSNLTRKQIENSPAIETHQPVSHQYEEEYYRYFGWPFYWQGDALWGMSGFPILEQTNQPLRRESALARHPASARTDVHLRSAQAVTGYNVRTGDGTIGHVCDFMVDSESWGIGQLVIKTGHRFSGQEVLMPTKHVERISYEDSTVFGKMSKAAVVPVPTQHQISERAAP